jgi:hypothetical protein
MAITEMKSSSYLVIKIMFLTMAHMNGSCYANIRKRVALNKSSLLLNIDLQNTQTL